MQTRHSKILESALNRTQREAGRLGGYALSTDHIFLAILKDGRGHAVEILKRMLTEAQLFQFKVKLERSLNSNNRLLLGESDSGTLSESESAFIRLENALRGMYLEMIASNHSSLHTGHLLMVILKDKGFISASILEQYGVSYNKANCILSLMPQDEDDMDKFDSAINESDDPISRETGDDHDFFDNLSSSEIKTSAATTQKGANATILDKFGVDLTKAAVEGKLDPVIGRTGEIDRLVQILGRYKKNNPVLIGEAGVGKSAIVEGLATRISKRDVPHTLLSKRIFTLDLAALVAGTKYRGQFEERIKSLLNELSKNRDIILFIDEIHTIVGAGSTQGTLDTANILKPALARGELQCIGATTLDEYREHIESDGALERRFQKIMVEPTSKEDTLNILKNIKEYYENYHLVTFSDEAIEACVELTDRYITDRCFPDKAIDVLDEAGSKAHTFNLKMPQRLVDLDNEIEKIRSKKLEAVESQNFEEAANLRNEENEIRTIIETERKAWNDKSKESRIAIDRAFIDEVVATMTGIPVERISLNEMSRLKNMADDLNNIVIGQEDAVIGVTRAILRSRAGLKDPNRPIGTFMFVGSTGVGKTHLAKALSKFMFDREDALIRVDMSEYSEKYNVSRLIGSPPGYVGYSEGGQLTEKVRRHPYSVILFDEIEKAHPDIFNIMLQIFDDGHLTDGMGRKVDFRNCIIIMTSNVGSKDVSNFGGGLGYSTSQQDKQLSAKAESLYRKALQKTFAPEFINRIDDIIVFRNLTTEDINKIVKIEFTKFHDRVISLGYDIRITPDAVERIVELGYEPKYGVRSLKRAILDNVEERFAEMIIDGKISNGDKIQVECSESDNGIELSINV